MTGLSMAKASNADLDAAMELYQILEKIRKWPRERFSDLGIEGYDDCETPLDAVLRAFRKGSLLRVVWGMAVVCDPENELLDPDSDVVAEHPKILKALEAQEKLARLVEAAEAMLTSYDSSPVVLRRVGALREAIAAAKGGA